MRNNTVRRSTEATVRVFRLRKKTMNLCACDIEYREHGVGDGVNDTVV